MLHTKGPFLFGVMDDILSPKDGASVKGEKFRNTEGMDFKNVSIKIAVGIKRQVWECLIAPHRTVQPIITAVFNNVCSQCAVCWAYSGVIRIKLMPAVLSQN